MKFNSQICTTKEQSERLLALGLNPDTADMGLVGDIPIILNTLWKNADPIFETPAWSLHKLIDLAGVSVEVSGLWVRISSTYRYEEKHNVFDNLIDAIADLINNNVFNHEYLEI